MDIPVAICIISAKPTNGRKAEVLVSLVTNFLVPQMVAKDVEKSKYPAKQRRRIERGLQEWMERTPVQSKRAK